MDPVVMCLKTHKTQSCAPADNFLEPIVGNATTLLPEISEHP